MIMGIHWTHLESVWSPSGPLEVPLLHKPVTGQELFFAVSYSKLALGFYFLIFPILGELKKHLNFLQTLILLGRRFNLILYSLK